MGEEEDSPVQQDWSSSLEPGPPHIKEEPGPTRVKEEPGTTHVKGEELWTSLESEQLQGQQDKISSTSRFQDLKASLKQRLLTAAPHELVECFNTTVCEYEKEIEQQKKLMDVILKPEIRLRRTGLCLSAPIIHPCSV